MLNIKFHKNHPLAVATSQVNKRRNNGFSTYILQQLCKCNQNGLRHAVRRFIWVRIKILQIC